MKDVSQYPVKHPFGATYSPWSPSHPHLGVDRPTPMRTPLLVNGQLIGYTGRTGDVDPHHHLQKVAQGVVVDPKNDGFNLSAPVVFETGEKPKIGKFIRIRDSQGVEWSSFHLDEILVKVGQAVGGEAMPNEGDVHNVYLEFNNRKATPQEVKTYTSKSWNAGDGLVYGKMYPEIRILKQQIATLQSQVTDKYEKVEVYRKVT